MAYVVARRLLSAEGEQLPAPEGPLAIRGTEGLVLSYAKCCTPIPGDPIVGHLSAGKGMVVHLETAATSVKSATTRKSACSSPGPRMSPASSMSNCASSWNTSAA
jgi:(p)ppGpp synthase/HD superfamily hydrolase